MDGAAPLAYLAELNRQLAPVLAEGQRQWHARIRFLTRSLVRRRYMLLRRRERFSPDGYDLGGEG